MVHILLPVFFFVQSVVPDTSFLTIIQAENVGDILALRGVDHVIAQLLHFFFELSLVSASPHAVVNGHSQFHLPAVATLCRTILLRPKALRFLVGIIGFQCGESVGLADLIAAFP